MVVMEQTVSNPVGFWRRLGANLLDGIIIGVPLSLLGYGLTGDSQSSSVLNAISFLYSLLLPIFWYGYTIGKRLLGIRIVRMNGENVGIGTMLLRTVVGGLLYTITFGIAAIISAIMVGAREDKRSIHDFIAGTYVTFDKP
ncbi:MAG: RDD family protein [Clostridia bacterium]